MLIIISLLFLLLIGYIVHKQNKFLSPSNTTDDGDNEFTQLDAMSDELDRLTEVVEKHQKDTHKSWIESL